jgi:putative membrane protein
MGAEIRPAAPARRFALLSRVSATCAAILAVMLGGFWLARWTGLGSGGAPYGFRATAFAVVAAGFALTHAWASWGPRIALRFFCVAIATSLATEMVGVKTGLVFGSYAYAADFGPKILGLVPLIIPLIWFSISYLASATSEAILGRGAASRAAALSAGLLLGYDLVADPNHVFRGGWSYAGGGFFHGVPLRNFVAWYAIGLAMFWLLLRAGRSRDLARVSTPSHVALAAFAYVGIMTHESLFAFFVSGLPAAGAVGLALVAVTAVLLARVFAASRRGAFRVGLPPQTGAVSSRGTRR